MKSTSSGLYRVAGRIHVQGLPHIFPPLALVERATDPWLARQLHLFNLADKDDDANAIRILFILWEDLGLAPPGLEEFEYVRHFVSHARINKYETVKFISAQLGPGTDHYNPFDGKHRLFLADWRCRVEAAVRAELEKRLAS